jgi:hypothetical protein
MAELVSCASHERLDAAILRLRCALATEDVLILGRRFLDIYKAYNPNQPRVPAGNSEGGRWTSEGGGSPVRLASSDKNPFGRAGRIGVALDAARRLIDIFRDENYLQDLFGNKVGTVEATSFTRKVTSADCANGCAPCMAIRCLSDSIYPASRHGLR